MLKAVVLSLLLLSSCSTNSYHELPSTSDRDPYWQLNPDKWTFNQNDLTAPENIHE